MKKRKLNNKGFSLVELIIVIAILAILVAIIGLAVVPYIEKSRVSKDFTTLDAIHRAIQTTVTEYSVDNTLTEDFAGTYEEFGDKLADAGGTSDGSDWQEKIDQTTGITTTGTNGSSTAAYDRMVSRAAKEGSAVQFDYHIGEGGDAGDSDLIVSCGDLAISSVRGRINNFTSGGATPTTEP